MDLFLYQESARNASNSSNPNLHLRQSILKASRPVAEKVLVRRNTKAGDGQRVSNMPIPRLTHHLLSPRIDPFDRLFPLWMIDFSLRRLEVMLAYISTSQGIGITFPMGCKSRVNVSAKAILNRRPCAFAKDLANNSRNSAPSSNASGGHT